MDLTWTPDGRILIPTKPGQLRVVQNGTLLPTPALDLSAVMCTDVEQGMGGVAVHPQFVTNHYIYVYYTFAKFGPCGTVLPVNRLSRFVLPASNVIDRSTEQVLMDTPQVGAGGHHNGGDIEFGADGFLYLSVGNGLLGSVGPGPGATAREDRAPHRRRRDPAGQPLLRRRNGSLQRHGAPPAGSPAGTKCQEVYAKGLRNPFRMARDPNAAGDRFYINDVGENDWEEIDALTPGADYGWPSREGPCVTFTTNCAPNAAYADPLHWYSHQGIGGAITGGAFVPNGLWPSDFDGKYLFTDYVFGQIYRLDPGGPNCRTCNPPTSAFKQTVFSDTPGISAMAFGPFGSTQALYYVTRGSNQLRRIVVHRHGEPVADGGRDRDAALRRGTADVNFSSAGSNDPDGNPLTYRWDFKDGSAIDTSANPSHVFTTAGDLPGAADGRRRQGRHQRDDGPGRRREPAARPGHQHSDRAASSSRSGRC